MKKSIFLLLLMVLLVGACGRMSQPVKPKASIYPKTYTVTP